MPHRVRQCLSLGGVDRLWRSLARMSHTSDNELIAFVITLRNLWSRLLRATKRLGIGMVGGLENPPLKLAPSSAHEPDQNGKRRRWKLY